MPDRWMLPGGCRKTEGDQRSMESTAFSVRSKRLASEGATPPREGSLPTAKRHSRGEGVRVARGPLAGMIGVLFEELRDGRWTIQLADTVPGVLICMDATQFVAK